MRPIHFVNSLVLLTLLGTSVLRAQNETRPAEAAAAEEVPQVRVLEIHGGNVKLDGWQLPSSNLPSGLSLHGIDMTYNFSGPVTPVLEIDGEVYVLDGQRLIRMEDAAPNRAANVYFLGQPEPNAPPVSMANGGAAMPASEGLDLSDDLEQAGEQAYLRQLSERDRTLYDQIQHEQSLELETFRLAGEYRQARDRDEQSRIEVALREKLSESFELKQQIRADEITQAESQIDELRRLLNERSARKEQIIERRLRELTGKRGN